MLGTYRENELRSFAEAFKVRFPSGGAFGLSGELGAGKTTLVRAFAPAGTRVVSPSFVLHQSYPEFTPPLEHFDLYRLEALTREGLTEIGYYDALERTRLNQGFLFVEWPEKAQDLTDLCLDGVLELSRPTEPSLSPDYRLVRLK